MSTGAIVAISVVGVAVVGVGVFLVVKRKAAPAKPTSTTDKVVGTVSSLIPIGVEIAKLWSSKDD